MKKIKALNNKSTEDTGFENTLLHELIETIQDSTNPEPKRSIVGRNTGRKIEVVTASENRDMVTISAPDGTIELQIKLTAKGPILQVSATTIELSATERISLNCNDLDIAVTNKIDLKCDGDMQQTVMGNLETKTECTAKMEARRIEVEATWGDVDIKANDDVRLSGERIFLNK